ncbi:MAG: hypothetical protein KC414_11840, partial [Romboutsia sp.]|nr:hypothetical protein [Romboutsia sp.]
KVLEDSPYNNNQVVHKKINFIKMVDNLSVLLRSKDIWLLGIYAGISYSITNVYGALWGVQFLAKAHSLDLYTVTVASSLIYLGIGFMVPILTWKFNGPSRARRFYLIASPLLLVVCLCIVLYMPNISKHMIYWLNFLLGILSSSLILSYTMVTEISPARARNTSIGVINTLALGVSPIFQSLIGFILEKQTDHVSPTKLIEVYSVADYRWSLTVLPVLILLGAVAAYYISDKPIED